MFRLSIPRPWALSPMTRTPFSWAILLNSLRGVIRPVMKTVWPTLMIFVLRRDRRGEGVDDLVDAFRRQGERDLGDLHAAALGLESPGIDRARMLEVGDEDLVAFLQIEAVGDEVQAFGRVAGQRDFVRRGVDEAGELVADGLCSARQEIIDVVRIPDLVY